MPANTPLFDYVFLGMGAGNSLLLHRLHEAGLLSNKRFAVAEPDAKKANDRTFCCWATPEEMENLGLLTWVSHSWSTVEIGGIRRQSILPMRYWHIRGIVVYDATRRLLEQYGAEAVYLPEKFLGYGAPVNEGYLLDFESGSICAETVFDSRPPTYLPTASNEAHLLQSFLGWEITAPPGSFNPDTVQMMDFRIPQQNSTQFVYVLPFSDDNALVEVTRFGTEAVNETEADALLRDYLAEICPEYQKLELERGIIPMSSATIAETAPQANWIFTGARADRIKPSTGYAFHNMAKDAVRIAQAMDRKGTPEVSTRKPRFAFYDRLLLKILEQRPNKGKGVFERLFRTTPMPQVLHFLSESTGIREEIQILSRLPFLLFFSFALRDIFQRLKNQKIWPLPLLATFALLVLNRIGMENAAWMAVGIGLFTIGIPHGALDHLVHLKPLKNLPLLRFIVLYLFAMGVCAAIWWLQADLALLFFLGYTAWHFGQADLRETGDHNPFTAAAWGVFVLCALLLPHAGEAYPIIQSIGAAKSSTAFAFFSTIPATSILPATACAGTAIAALSKSRQQFLPATAVLLAGTQLPLLQAFAVYFIAQHSLNGWKHLQADLQLNSARMWMHALPFTLGALLLGTTAFLLLETPPVGLFFVALSCLSFPHVVAMHRFYTRRQAS
jgi:lycopene beta-cyclase